MLQRAMKVAFLVNKFPAISETFVLDQVVGLLCRGHDVHIIARNQSANHVKHREVDSYDLQSQVRYRPTLPEKLPKRLAKLAGLYLANAIRQPERVAQFFQLAWRNRSNRPVGQLYYGCLLLGQSYDIIHCQYGYIGDTAAMLQEVGLLSSPIVTTFHGYDINAYPKKYGLNCYRRLFKHGDCFTVGSNFAKERLLELGAPSERVRVWPMGISLDRFHFRERYRQGKESVRLLTVARLVEEKGLKFSIKAVAKLIERGYRVQYRIIGEGEQRPELETLVYNLGLEGAVCLPGEMARGEVREQYDWAHLFVMPGVTASSGAVDTQGIVLAEAQASGLPVVATDAGGMPESICVNKSGFLVPERDVEALVDRLALLIDHPKRWPEMGQAGRAYVKEKYDLRTLLDELAELYQSLISEKA